MASGSSSAGGSSAGGGAGSGGSSGRLTGSGTFECNICAETVKGNALPCAHCDFSCCGECAKRYWADHPFNPPACMSCRNALSVPNLEMCFSKTYVKNGMEGARRNALFESEKGLFLQTQQVLFPVVHAYETQLVAVEDLRLKLCSLEQKSLNLRVRVADLEREFVRTGSDKAFPVFREWTVARDCVSTVETEVEAAFRDLSRAADIAKALHRHLSDYSLGDTTDAFHRYVGRNAHAMPAGVAQRVLGTEASTAAPAPGPATGPGPALPAPPKHPNRIAPCTRAGCLGMYSSDTGVCMVCTAEHCTKCAKRLDTEDPGAQPPEEAVVFAVAGSAFSVTVDADPSGAPKKKAARHKCNPDDVATAKYLATTTKPCPRCHTSIQRESGCAQMLCIKCHTVFNWNTLKEETGVIHNPHFYQMSTEIRQRIVDERASRGITAGREVRFLAGVGPRGGGCDVNAEHDPLCVEFTSPVFLRLMDRALKDDAALLRCALEVHRHAVHCSQVELPGIENTLGDARRFGEQRTRPMRLAYLNGGKYVKYLDVVSVATHPLKFKSHAHVVVDGEKPLTHEMFKRNLMRIDTERTKLVNKAELLRTFAAACEDTLRLALASTPSELKTLVRSAIEMKVTLHRELAAVTSAAGHKRARDEAEGAAAERLAPVPPAAAVAAPPTVRVTAPAPVRVVAAEIAAWGDAAPAAAAAAIEQIGAGFFRTYGNSDIEDEGGEEDDGSDSEPF
jgi:hypothetical protein